MATDTSEMFYCIIITGAIFTSLTLAQQPCTDIKCYVSLGKASSRTEAYRTCANRGYQPVRIYNKETANRIAEKYSDFWLNIQSHDPGQYTYVNGKNYHAIAGEEAPPSQKHCALIYSDMINYKTMSVNPNLEYCYKENYALCAKKNCSSNCYFLTTTKKSWFDSRNYCQSMAADLAPVVMADGIPQFQGALWIGLRQEIWYNVENNKEAVFTNWAKVKPEDVTKKCVVSGQNGMWIDVPCQGEEHNILCHADEALTEKPVALIAGVTTGAVVFLVLLVILIFCLCRRNRKTTAKNTSSCPILPLSCCVRQHKTKLKEEQPSEQNNKRQSIRDFVNGLRVPDLRKSLFKERKGPHNEEDASGSSRSGHSALQPIRKAPDPPPLKKTKPLPPTPRKQQAPGERPSHHKALLRPFSGLKQSIMEHLSKSPHHHQREASTPENESQTDRDYDFIKSNNSQQEPVFLDKRQFVPVREITRKQNEKTNTPGGTSGTNLPPPPMRQAPNLKKVVGKQLPPVPPPKPDKFPL